MNRMKVLTVVGTRPEIIRLSRVICSLEQAADHILVHTGQNYDYELNEIFFRELNIRKPDYFLESAVDCKSAAETIGNIIAKIDSVLLYEKPDAVLILGDTNSCLSALPAKRRKIPVFHMEAGNRCFDQRVPEEINRKVVDHTSDINLTYSSIAREYLLREGLPPDQVIKIGSPMYEVLHHNMPAILKSDILERLDLSKQQYFIASLHREENVDTKPNLHKIANILNEIAHAYKVPVVLSAHPRTRIKLSENNVTLHENVRTLKPFGFFDYVNLQINSLAVLSDSGTINEEASILNFPALNLREAHERPEGMEEAAVMMVGLNKDRVFQGLAILNSQKRGEERSLRLVDDYNIPNVSDKVVRIIHSYTDYVNRVVWKKY